MVAVVVVILRLGDFDAVVVDSASAQSASSLCIRSSSEIEVEDDFLLEKIIANDFSTGLEVDGTEGMEQRSYHYSAQLSCC